MKNLILLFVVMLAGWASAQEPDTLKQWYKTGELKSTLISWNQGTEFAYYKYTELWQNGKLKIQGHYDELGRKVSTWTSWYENGQLCRKRTWISGVLHGEETVWTNSGQLVYKSQWKRGKRHGEVKCWNSSNGELIVHRVYKKSKLINSISVNQDGGLLIVKN